VNILEGRGARGPLSSEWTSLCNQRLRWKYGRLATIWRHHDLFFVFERMKASETFSLHSIGRRRRRSRRLLGGSRKMAANKEAGRCLNHHHHHHHHHTRTVSILNTSSFRIYEYSFRLSTYTYCSQLYEYTEDKQILSVKVTGVRVRVNLRSTRSNLLNSYSGVLYCMDRTLVEFEGYEYWILLRIC
jgi:hypothetical protein